MSSQEAPTENHNAHESPERPPRRSAPSGERSGGGAKGRFEDEQSGSSEASETTAVGAEDIGRREPDWGDRRRRHRPLRGNHFDFRERGREWGPTAALSSSGTTATSYGDERRRGRRDPTQSDPTGTHRQPDCGRTSTTGTDAGQLGPPRAIESEPVRRWGAVERVRTTRLRPVRPQFDGFEAADGFGTRRTNGAGVEDGPAREHERAGYRYTSEIDGYRPRLDGNATEQTGQGHSTF